MRERMPKGKKMGAVGNSGGANNYQLPTKPADGSGTGI
jgi:hypothetical protein